MVILDAHLKAILGVGATLAIEEGFNNSREILPLYFTHARVTSGYYIWDVCLCSHNPCHLDMPPLIEVLDNNSSFAVVPLHSRNGVIILATGIQVLQDISRNNQQGVY